MVGLGTGRRTGGWSFRPAWWAIAGTLLGCVVTLRLAWWQFDRGRAREAMQAEYLSGEQSSAQREGLALTLATAPPRDGHAIAAQVRGRWLDRSVLLDNQVQDRQAGYDVLTPLQLDGGGLLMVDRGWLPRARDGRSLPKVAIAEREVALQGLWKRLPQPALQLGTHNCEAAATQWPRIVEYPTAADLGCLYGATVADGMLLLDRRADDGFRRDWSVVDLRFPPSRHYGYAAQWLAFALTLITLFIKLNLKRRP